MFNKKFTDFSQVDVILLVNKEVEYMITYQQLSHEMGVPVSLVKEAKKAIIGHKHTATPKEIEKVKAYIVNKMEVK